MEVFDAITTRRSVRHFTEKSVMDDDIKDMLKAAMQAPNAGNQQPWRFIIITDQEILGKITEAHPYAKAMQTAQAAILVCSEVKTEKFCGFWVQDCSAATQNILLTAHGKGIGSVWLGIYPMQERIDVFKKIFELPSDIYPFALVALGYPSEEYQEPLLRYDPNKVKFNKWIE